MKLHNYVISNNQQCPIQYSNTWVHYSTIRFEQKLPFFFTNAKEQNIFSVWQKLTAFHPRLAMFKLLPDTKKKIQFEI